MRFLFKTAYEQDIRLFRDGVTAVWYGLLAVVVVLLPGLLSGYYVGEITWVFIYGICGVSLMVLVGYTGLLSLGHAAFLGIGAYAHAYFLQHGRALGRFVALAVMITTACGIVVGLPALRMTGIYLAIATLAFAVIIQEVFTRWEAVTKGFAGMAVEKPVIFGVHFDSNAAFYYLCAAILALTLWMTRNLLRSPTGRAWIAIRDSEIAAQSMGVNLAVYKSIAFAYSAALMGLAGALFAHKIAYLAPDIFTILLSIQLLLLVIVGGLGSLHGAVFGAIFVALLPPIIAILRDSIPATLSDVAAITGIGLIGAVGKAIGDFLKKPGVEAGIFRFDPCPGHPAGAVGHVWPMDEDQALLLHFPHVQAQHLQAPEELHEVGAAAVTFFQADNLSINFGGIRAVDDVSFAVSKGEVFTIIGPNGAGKTTIFNLVSRIYDPTGRPPPVRGPRHHQRAAAPHRRARHRPDVPEHRAVRACHPARQPAAGAPRAQEVGLLRRAALPSLRAGDGGRTPRGGREGDRFPRPTGVPRRPDRQPPLRRAQGDRIGARPVHQPEAAAARRALLRPQRRGDGGHGVLDRGHQERCWASPY